MEHKFAVHQKVSFDYSDNYYGTEAVVIEQPQSWQRHYLVQPQKVRRTRDFNGCIWLLENEMEQLR